MAERVRFDRCTGPLLYHTDGEDDGAQLRLAPRSQMWSRAPHWRIGWPGEHTLFIMSNGSIDL